MPLTATDGNTAAGPVVNDDCKENAAPVRPEKERQQPNHDAADSDSEASILLPPLLPSIPLPTGVDNALTDANLETNNGAATSIAGVPQQQLVRHPPTAEEGKMSSLSPPAPTHTAMPPQQFMKCRCRRTQCIQLLCVCFKAKIQCSDRCGCMGCHNGRPPKYSRRRTLVPPQPPPAPPPLSNPPGADEIMRAGVTAMVDASSSCGVRAMVVEEETTGGNNTLHSDTLKMPDLRNPPEDSEDEDDDVSTEHTPTLKKPHSSRTRKLRKYKRVVGKGQNLGPKMTEAKLRKMLRKTYHPTINGKRIVVDMSGEHYFRIMNHRLLCECCDKVIHPNTLGQHTASERHATNRDARMRKDAEAAEDDIHSQSPLQNENIVGSTQVPTAHGDDMQLLRAFFAGNVPTKAMEDMAPYLETWAGKATPGWRALDELVPSLHHHHIQNIRRKVKGAFPEYSLIIDGSPFFANAECIKIRMVDKDFKIFELVVCIQLDAGSLDAGAIAEHIICTIEDRLEHELSKFRAISLNPASPNKLALTKLEEDNLATPFKAFCVSHGINTCGNKFNPEKGAKFLQQLGKMVSPFLCEARSLHSETFNQPAQRGNGVGFGVKLQHAAQVNEIGVVRMRDEYVRECVSRKFSEKSSKKALALVADTHKAARIMVELAAVSDAGLPIVSATYTSESDAPTILVEDETLADLSELMDNGVDGFCFPELEAKAAEAEKMMAQAMKPFEDDVATAVTAVDAKAAAFEAAKLVLKERSESSTFTSSCSRRRSAPKKYKAMKSGKQQPVDPAIEEAKTAHLASTESKLLSARIVLSHKISALESFKEGKLISKEDFVQHGKNCVRAGFDHYHTLFLDPAGDYYEIKRAFHVARIFNVRTAAAMDVDDICEAVRELVVFRMPEFTPSFILGMLDEVEAFKRAVDATILRDGTDDDFWSMVPGAVAYDRSLETKKQTCPTIDPDKIWLDDPVEKSRRLWEWWHLNHGKFHYFSKAARLIVLVQVSSGAVEGAFSQVKYIIETIGESGEENVETRLMQRMNKY